VLHKLVQLIRAALRGDEYDYTTGSMQRAVILLAVPMILELSLESVFALVDIYFVGKLGKNAIAAVGLTEGVITILYSVAIGLSTGASAMVARRIGEKNNEEASHAGAQSILIGLVCVFVTSIFGVWFASDILRMMGASPEVISEGSIFTRIMMGGSVVIVMLFLINGIFRGAGKAAIAMKSLWLASALNIVLCPLLIYTFGLGLKGAAIATTIGRGCGVLYQCYFLWKGKNQLKLKAKQFVPHWETIKNLIGLAWPVTFQFIIASASWIIITFFVADIGGTSASAGYQIAIRNVVFFILPAWGLSNAAAALVGQNLGAKLPERAEQSVWLCTKYNIIFMSFVTLLFVGVPEYIIRFFSSEEAVVLFGAKALRIIGTGYVFYGIGMVMIQSLNGAGDTKTPTWINFICFWVIQIPIAYYLAYHTSFKTTGAICAIPMAETLIAASAFFYFKKGRWKKMEI
jgi:putative MATE family efflux protein